MKDHKQSGEWHAELTFPPVLPDELHGRLRARLLMAYSNADGTPAERIWSFIQFAFDGLAEELFNAGALTESLLFNGLRVLAHDAAITSGINPGGFVSNGRSFGELDEGAKKRLTWLLGRPTAKWQGRLILASPTPAMTANTQATDIRAIFAQVINGSKAQGESFESALRQWCDKHHLARTPVTDWRAERIKGRVSPDKCAEIEAAVRSDASVLNLAHSE